MNHTFLLVGHSGCGKTTLINTAVEAGFNQPGAYTTRKPRKRGDDIYTFVSPDEFLELQRTGKLIFEEIFNGNLYATNIEDLKGISFIPVAPGGLHRAKTILDEDEYTAIYIECDEFERWLRMTSRGDSIAQADRRVEHDKKKFKGIYHHCEYKITSSTPKEDYDMLIGIVKEVLEEKGFD